MESKAETIDNPNKQEIKNELEKNDPPHAQILSSDAIKHSGKDDNQLHPGLKSVAPASGKKVDWSNKEKKYKILKDVSKLIGDDEDEEYPYDELEFEEAFFVPTKPNETTDMLLAQFHKSIKAVKEKYGEIEVDDNGDKIMEHLTIETRKRNDDGSIRLNGDEPIKGANFTQRYKYNYTRNFIVKPVYAGQELADGVEAEGDGVVVIRVA